MTQQCISVNVVSPPTMEAGFSEKEKLLIVGLYFGFAYQAIKKFNNMRHEKIR